MLQIGYNNNDISEVLVEEIQSLYKKYPKPTNQRQGIKRNARKSKKSPVIASNDEIYERDYIEKYLRQHQTFPNKQEQVDVDLEISMLQPDLVCVPPSKKRQRLQAQQQNGALE